MQIILNNIRVLCSFGILGSITILFVFLTMLNAEKYRIFGAPISQIISILFLLCIAGLHFLSGKLFLHSFGNVFANGASFLLIITLALIYAVYAGNAIIEWLLRMLFSPSLIVGGLAEAVTGEQHERLSLCIVVFVQLLMQYFGMIINTGFPH
jgi:hypothetical protein